LWSSPNHVGNHLIPAANIKFNVGSWSNLIVKVSQDALNSH
jgi:hypothetical protein